MAQKCGAAGFIQKTSNAKALAQSIERFLGGSVTAR
jgi:DNA-binding NarL/FixJ family response regulator